MATSDKCPRCDCEGNKLACEMCYYFGFKCPGNCACCADRRDPTQRQVKVDNCNNQKEPVPRQVSAGNSNNQRPSTERRVRVPFRPLILRNCTKASGANNQKKVTSSLPQPKAVSSNVSEPSANKVNSAVSVPSTKKVNSTVSVPSTNKVNSTVFMPSTNKVNSTVSVPSTNKTNRTDRKSSFKKVNPYKVKKSKKLKVNAEKKLPTLKVTYVAEPALPPALKDYAQKEAEECKRLWNRLFWPQWEKVPCEPPNACQNSKPSIISKEKLKETVSELIGDHCLNCQCRNPRESCDICRRCDFQCLGTCMCCLPYRAGQRYMVFITRGIFQLPDGSYYGGGSVNISYTVPDNLEIPTEKNPKAVKKSVWVRIMQEIQANMNLINLFKATAIGAFFVAIVITLNRNKTLLEMLMRMRPNLSKPFLDLKL